MKIVLVSHGPLASGILASAKMLVGELDNVSEIELHEEDLAETFGLRLSEEVDNVDEEILILTDIPGGTPCNQSLLIYSKHANIEVISGMNLPMVLDAYLKKDQYSLLEICDEIINAAHSGIIHVSKKLNEVNEEGIDLL